MDNSGLYGSNSANGSNKMDWIKLIPIGWLMAIFFSLVIYITYYRVFQINIIQYLSITEIPYLFVPELLIVIILVYFLLAIDLIIGHKKGNYHSLGAKSYEKVKNILLIFLGLLMSSILYLEESLLIKILIVVIFLTYWVNVIQNKYVNSIFLTYFSLFIGILLVAILYGYNLGRHDKVCSTTFGNLVILENGDTLKFDWTMNELLPTSNYLLYYSKKDSLVKVINKSNIQSYVYKSYIVTSKDTLLSINKTDSSTIKVTRTDLYINKRPVHNYEWIFH